jgi:hypothetical protein
VDTFSTAVPKRMAQSDITAIGLPAEEHHRGDACNTVIERSVEHQASAVCDAM